MTATVFAGTDTYAMPLAVFNGSGKTSQSNYSRSGILEAYEAAFAQIGNNLLADLQFARSHQDDGTAVTTPPPREETSPTAICPRTRDKSS